MAGFTVPISTVVSRLNANITFFQPVIEAIANSLEAKATKIDIQISFIQNKTLTDNNDYSLKSISVTDNGEGFTSENINSFMTYMSEYKIKLGCKGIGRITWLKVFSSIDIKSFIQNKEINILFNEKFSDQNIQEIELAINNPSKTIVTFSDVREKYHKDFSNLIIDKSLYKLQDLILSSLLVKLFLLDRENKSFNITISNNVNDNIVYVSNKDVKNFLIKDFEIEKNNNFFPFKCYYRFDNYNILNNKVFYCANGRTVLVPNKKISCLKSQIILL